MTELQQPTQRRFLTVRQAAQTYPAMTEGALRWLRFNGSKNGFDSCVLNVGRRVLIDADLFEKWLDGHKAGA